MSVERRLSVTFGAFSCDVVGYDNPFSVLNRVVDLFSDVAKDNPSFAAGAVPMSDLERARVAASLADEAARLDEVADPTVSGGTRYVVSRDENAAAAAASEEDETSAAVAAVLAEAAGAPVEEIVEAVIAGELQEPTPQPTRRPLRLEIPEKVEEEPVIEEAAASFEVEETVEEIIEEPVVAEYAEPAPIEEEVEATTLAVEAEEQVEDEAPSPLRPVLRAREPEEQPEEPVRQKPKVTIQTVRNAKPAETEVEETVQPAAEPLRLRPVTNDDAEATPVAAQSKLRASREDDDDPLDNFLFADVDEALREDRGDREARREKDVLNLNPEFDQQALRAEADRGHETNGLRAKARNRLAGLFKFGKADETDGGEEMSAATVDNLERLREPTVDAMHALDEAKVSPIRLARPERVGEVIEFDDETSPAAFARRVGATSLQDLLEASAVYMALVEGKSKFSRRDVMQALNQIGGDKDYTQEARLKSFRKLLSSGSLVRVEDGLFTVSQATRFGYETQLQA
ncbi:MAG: hypothetical protein AAF401_03655 [Pseudomonadota bacterium]